MAKSFVRNVTVSILWIGGIVLILGASPAAYGAKFSSCLESRLEELAEEYALQKSAMEELDRAGLAGEEDFWVTLKLRHENWSVHPIAYRAVNEEAGKAGLRPEELPERLLREPPFKETANRGRCF